MTLARITAFQELEAPKESLPWPVRPLIHHHGPSGIWTIIKKHQAFESSSFTLGHPPYSFGPLNTIVRGVTYYGNLSLILYCLAFVWSFLFFRTLADSHVRTRYIIDSYIFIYLIPVVPAGRSTSFSTISVLHTVELKSIFRNIFS